MSTLQGVIESAMRSEAAYQCVSGVGGIAFFEPKQFFVGLTDMSLFVVNSFFRSADVEVEGDSGSNYAAQALSKFAEMLVTFQNSGTVSGRIPMRGEFGWQGGLIESFEEDEATIWVLMVFFSGSAEQVDEIDLAIAQVGLKSGMEYLTDLDEEGPSD